MIPGPTGTSCAGSECGLLLFISVGPIFPWGGGGEWRDCPGLEEFKGQTD
jgi:hypothetical protein